jgi:hypothetical protein
MLKRNWRYTRLLKKYEKIYKPIFIIQDNHKESDVYKTKQEVEKMLKLSKNDLFEAKKIEIHLIYFRDPRFDFCEEYDDYLERRLNTVKDALRDWSNTIDKKDRLWVQEHLLQQDIDIKETFEEKVFTQIQNFTAKFSKN